MSDEFCVALEVLLDLLLESLGDDGVFIQLVISSDVVQCSCCPVAPLDSMQKIELSFTSPARRR